MVGSNRQIYKNTLIIYVRMLFVTFVGLFSSRFVLQALGASDYGLYNVVGGLIALFNILATAMSTTSRRFINVEMGKDDGNLNKVFNICLLLHIVFAVLLLIIAETFGNWYVHNYLNVVDGKQRDAMFVFQFSTIIACVGIINIPYQSLIEAYEQFGKSAVIDIVSTAIKFTLVIVLLFYPGNALRFYAVLTCVVSLLSFVLYHFVCYRSWADVIKPRYYRGTSLYKEMFVFNNYIALGAAASVGKSQGSNMIVNYFFGTITNAAFAIAYQVENYVYMFVNKLTMASNPQIAINYSSDNMDRVYYLVEKNSRFCILIMMLFFFPLISEIDFLLRVWLGNVPEETVLLCTLTLILGLITSFSEGTNGYIQASGKVKWFLLTNSLFTLFNLPMSIVLFKMGFDAFWILLCFISTSILARVNSLYLMKKILKFDIWHYIRNAYIPPMVIIVIMTCVTMIYRSIPINSSFLHLLGIFGVLILTGVLVCFVGLTKTERISLMKFLAKNVL